MTTPRHSVSVAAVVVDDAGRVLVIRRRDNGKWEPPGGVLELDERIDDALEREVLEETGLAIRVGSLTGVYKNMARGIVALVFRAHRVDGEPAPSMEAAEVAWLAPRDIETHMDEAYAVRIQDALTAGAVAIRHHDGERLT